MIAQLGSAGRDRATVYRCLRHFERVGLLRKIEVGDRVWRFTVVGDRVAGAALFECTSCGKLFALPEVSLRAPASAPRAVREKQIQIVMRGVCDDCT